MLLADYFAKSQFLSHFIKTNARKNKTKANIGNSIPPLAIEITDNKHRTPTTTKAADPIKDAIDNFAGRLNFPKKLSPLKLFSSRFLLFYFYI